MPSFNLIDKEWIPVLDQDSNFHEVGLKDALTRADEWREIYTDSPMQTAALYRLLLALRIAIFPETLSKESNDGWFALWNQGRFAEDRVQQYLEDNRQRFDLFDEKHPFYQDAILRAKELKNENKRFEQSIAQTKMFIEETGNAILTSHVFYNSIRLLDPKTVSRGLVALQLAAPNDGRSMKLKDESPAGKTNGLLMDSAMFWIRGNSLFEALMLNAPPDIGIYPVDDRPNWLRQEPMISTKPGRSAYGPLDYLTWQTRRILLCWTMTSEDIAVNEARMVQGEYLKYRTGGHPIDPLMVFLGDKSGKPVYYKFEKGRALWRDAHVFLKLLEKSAKRLPRSFEWIENQRGELKRKRWEVDVFGIRTGTQAANFDLWRHERMPLHVAYLNLNNAELRGDLQACLDYAECMGGSDEKEKKAYFNRDPDVVRLAERLYIRTKNEGKDILIRSLLYDACFRFARLLRCPSASPPPTSEYRLAGLGKEQIKGAEALCASLQSEEHYWPALGLPFYELLDRLAAAYDSFDENAIEAVKKEWRATVRKVARDAFRQTTISFGQDARTLHAIASAEEVLFYGSKPPGKRDQPQPERLI